MSVGAGDAEIWHVHVGVVADPVLGIADTAADIGRDALPAADIPIRICQRHPGFERGGVLVGAGEAVALIAVEPMNGRPVAVFAGHVEAELAVELIAEAETAETGAFEAGVENVKIRGLEGSAPDAVEVVARDAEKALEIPIADAAWLGRQGPSAYRRNRQPEPW
jgi:hypothetical protein